MLQQRLGNGQFLAPHLGKSVSCCDHDRSDSDQDDPEYLDGGLTV
jgi:hypothetical protein